MESTTLRLPGFSESFSSEPENTAFNSFQLSQKQRGAIGLVRKLKLREVSLDESKNIGTMHPSAVIKELIEKKTSKHKADLDYLKAIQSKLLPSLGDLCLRALLEIEYNEQIASQPMKSFCSFLDGVRSKFSGLDTSSYAPFLKFLSNPILADLPILIENSSSIFFENSVPQESLDSVQKFLVSCFESDFLQPPELSASTLSQTRAALLKERTLRGKLEFGNFALGELANRERFYSYNKLAEDREILCYILNIPQTKHRAESIYEYLLSRMTENHHECPAEFFLHALLQSYAKLALNTLYVLFLVLSFLVKFHYHDWLENKLGRTAVWCGQLLEISSLMGVKHSDQHILLLELVLPCFPGLETQGLANLETLWTYENSSQPWVPALFQPKKAVPIKADLDLINYGESHPGLVNSDRWLHLHWSGVHTASDLELFKKSFLEGNPASIDSQHLDRFKVFVDRFNRLQHSRQDRTLREILICELGVPNKSEQTTVEPVQKPAKDLDFDWTLDAEEGEVLVPITEEQEVNGWSDWSDEVPGVEGN